MYGTTEVGQLQRQLIILVLILIIRGLLKIHGNRDLVVYSRGLSTQEEMEQKSMVDPTL